MLDNARFSQEGSKPIHEQSDGPGFNFQQFLHENMGSIESIIRSYVIRMGLSQGESIHTMTLDILNETTVEALAHIEAFDTVRQPRAWFLAIAANMVKRKRAALVRSQQHEYPVGMLTNDVEAENESDFFDRISRLAHASPEQEVEVREQVNEMLALVSPADRTIVRLAFLQDMDAHHLALALNVSEGTARVRLHRALNRLRLIWQQHEQPERSRDRHE